MVTVQPVIIMLLGVEPSSLGSGEYITFLKFDFLNDFFSYSERFNADSDSHTLTRPQKQQNKDRCFIFSSKL